MRKIILLIGSILFLCVLKSNGQEWIRIYGDTVSTLTSKVIEHYDKGYLFAGKQEEGWTSYAWLMKTDINGVRRWSKAYGIPQKLNKFNAARMTDDGGWICCGPSTLESTSGCTDPLLVRIDPCGEVMWCRIYQSLACNSTCYDMSVVDGTGYMALFDHWTSNEEKTIWLFRLDSVGDVVWAKVYATSPDFWSEWSHSLLRTNDSCFVITGEAYYPDSMYPDKKIIKIILIKVNSDGEAIFEVPWGTDNGVYSDGRLSAVDANNNIYTSGRRARTTAPFGDSPCLFKTSVAGDPLYYMDLKPVSKLGESGTINWFQDSTLVQCIDWFDFSDIDSTAVIKTDTLGNIIKEKFLLLNEDDIIRAADITFNDRLILSGSVFNKTSQNWQSYAFKLTSDLEYDSVYTTPFTYDSLCPHAITSDTIPLDDCEVVVVGIDDPVQNPEKTKLKAYPNPAEHTITIEMPQYLVRESEGNGITATTYYHQWNSVRLDVFDLFGKLMHSEEIPKQTKKTTLDISSWPSGMYLARIVFRDEVVGVTKFVKN